MTKERIAELLRNGEGLTADPQLKDGDVFRTEVSLKSLEVASIDAEVAPKGTQVAQKEAEVAQKGSEVAQISLEVAQRVQKVIEELDGHGRADAIENAVAVYKCIIEDSRIAIPAIESKTHLSNGSVKNAIRLLRINEIIVRSGSNRSGKWEVLV